MSIKETIARLEEMADDREDKVLPGCIGWDEIEPLREAAALLRTHPDAQPNEPLTLEELREMDGQPVWIVSSRGSGWCIVQWHGVNKSWMYFSQTGTAEGMTATPITAKDYGDTWVAYRRPPKEEA